MRGFQPLFLGCVFSVFYTIWCGAYTVSGAGFGIWQGRLTLKFTPSGKNFIATAKPDRFRSTLHSDISRSQLVDHNQRVFAGVLVIILSAGEPSKANGMIKFYRRHV